MVQICRCRDGVIMEHKEMSIRWCLRGGRVANKWMNANMSIKRKERKEEQHPIKEKEDNWWRHEGEKNVCCVLTGPRCPEVIVLGDCSADICLPAALYCFFSSRSHIQIHLKSSTQPWQIHHKRHNQDYIVLQVPTCCLVHYLWWWYIHEAFYNLNLASRTTSFWQHA